MQQQTIGAVLAGGASTRMGADKALVELGGQTLLARVLDSLRASGVAPIVVGRDDAPDATPAIADPAGLVGPAAGLLAALDHAAGADVLLVATDQPFIRPASARELLAVATHDAVVPVADRWRQVTFAVYRASCHQPLRDLLDGDPQASIQELLDRVAVYDVLEPEWRSWGETGRSWLSIDSPDDLAAAADLL